MFHFDRKTTAAGLALALAWFPAAPAQAQIPDTFTNLEVLPRDISKNELVSIMREFAGALGQRCSFCHVGGENPGSLEGMDFATDKLEHKKVARNMMKMVADINDVYVAQSGLESPARVSCVTCHHGVAEPKTIDAIVLGAAETEGLPAAQDKYRALRKEYYGKAAYDFSAGPLNKVAETLAQEREDVDGAIAIMKLNLEFNGDAAYSHILLGQIYAQKGDKAAAAASIKKALELEPDNSWAKRLLDKLQSGE